MTRGAHRAYFLRSQGNDGPRYVIAVACAIVSGDNLMKPRSHTERGCKGGCRVEACVNLVHPRLLSALDRGRRHQRVNIAAKSTRPSTQ